MGSAVLFVALVLAMAGVGCGGSAGTCTTGCGGAGGAAGLAGRMGGGGAPGTAGTGGGAGAGLAGGAGGQIAGAAGGGGHGGQAGSSAGAGGFGGGGGAGGAGGSGGAGGAGGVVACGEPASCEAYDNNPDAHLSAEITCLSPSSATANVAFTLAVFGHHLATGPISDAIVTVGGVTLNGVPASACHLDVAVPASAVASPGQAPVVVSPGGWTLPSAAATLTVH